MKDDISDLLPESIGRLGAGEHPPAGLAGRVLRRERQRRVRLRAATATGTAGVAAMAVLAATVFTNGAGRRPGRELPAQTTAYVLGRAEHATESAERAGLIQEIDASGREAFFSVQIGECYRGTVISNCWKPSSMPALMAPEAHIWSYHRQLREEGFSATGKLVFDASTTITTTPKHLLLTGEVANYQGRTWWRANTPESLLNGAFNWKCRFGNLPAPDGATTDWPAAIHAALACRAYHVVGHQRIGNINAIKLVSNFSGPFEALWVDASTYLPVRVAWTLLDTPIGLGSLVGNFHWLKPTKANLANLTVRIPRSFRQIATRGLAMPGFGEILEMPNRPVLPPGHATIRLGSPSPKPSAS